PNKSPHFDKQWAEHGHMDRAVELIHGWLAQHKPADATLEVVRIEGRTPLIFMEIPGEVGDTVVLYGHLDKQPEMTGWAEGKGPWVPVIEGGKLYGRGGADDGYAAFASLTAINALRKQGVPHARCVLIIEACEESGSYDLPAYIDHLADRIGTPSLVVCLDSGAGNYEQLWNTTSLRGLVGGTLRVDIVREGLHSGGASGAVPSSFRIARILLDRIEDVQTGLIKLPALQAEVPQARREQNALAAQVLGDEPFPFVEGAGPVHADPAANHLARTWQATLSVTGVDGVPPIATAGNVLRPYTALKLSLRLPPSVDGQTAYRAVKAELEREPPYGARVSFIGDFATGWDAPPIAEWLHASATKASQAFYGKPMMYMGEGGTIPFMGMLGQKFPEAQFLITGVLGPESNAHGPNEFL
ncbi:MAG: M20/M25/M40 family metallo-hydrolase, partial [Myxococcales bacterium]|nr:M20/M25/M40 family metallo-hydrolase [Myxococcales bacterium]